MANIFNDDFRDFIDALNKCQVELMKPASAVIFLKKTDCG